ncbi:MAG: hypothetical protein COC16_01620 [Lutibacter sp.]|nr:MAG: hypothetical protein COC16_01620 [Lutibacter sp.]
MKNIFIVLFIFLIFGCTKKEVKLPTLGTKGIQEIHNHSQIWFFLTLKNNDTIATVNRKNTISTTHWLFNIDKRLPLKTIIPSIQKLQYNHANSFHSKEGMHNYFSYSDTISKKLSFLKFDHVEFKTDSLLSKYYIKKHSSKYLKYNNINLTFNPTNTWINDAKMVGNEFRTTLLEFIEFTTEANQTMLHFNFNEKLSYQDYLFYKTMIHSFEDKNIIVNEIEFIFNPTIVPDCGCE